MTEPAARLDASAPPAPAGAEAVGLLDHRQGIGPRRGAPRLHRGARSAAPSSCSRCRWCSRWCSRASSPSPTSSGCRISARMRSRRSGLTESLLTVVYALAMGLGIGATALVARRIGEKDPEGAGAGRGAGARARAAGLVVLGVTGALLAPRLLALMGGTPSVIATGRGYATIMLGGEAASSCCFRGERHLPRRGRRGDRACACSGSRTSSTSCWGRCSSSGSVRFPRLGVTGAAIATTIGRGGRRDLRGGALFAMPGRRSCGARTSRSTSA